MFRTFSNTSTSSAETEAKMRTRLVPWQPSAVVCPDQKCGQRAEGWSTTNRHLCCVLHSILWQPILLPQAHVHFGIAPGMNLEAFVPRSIQMLETCPVCFVPGQVALLIACYWNYVSALGKHSDSSWRMLAWNRCWQVITSHTSWTCRLHSTSNW